MTQLKDVMTPQEWRDYQAKREAGRDSKYGAIPTTTADGRTFDSIWESEFYKECWVLQQVGEVEKIEHKVVFDLVVNGVWITSFELDFRVTYTPKYPRFGQYPGGVRHVDTKSSATLTALFRVKQKLMLALFGIVVEAVFDPSLKPKKNPHKRDVKK